MESPNCHSQKYGRKAGHGRWVAGWHSYINLCLHGLCTTLPLCRRRCMPKKDVACFLYFDWQEKTRPWCWPTPSGKQFCVCPSGLAELRCHVKLPKWVGSNLLAAAMLKRRKPGMCLCATFCLEQVQARFFQGLQGGFEGLSFPRSGCDSDLCRMPCTGHSELGVTPIELSEVYLGVNNFLSLIPSPLARGGLLLLLLLSVKISEQKHETPHFDV